MIHYLNFKVDKEVVSSRPAIAPVLISQSACFLLAHTYILTKKWWKCKTSQMIGTKLGVARFTLQELIQAAQIIWAHAMGQIHRKDVESNMASKQIFGGCGLSECITAHTDKSVYYLKLAPHVWAAGRVSWVQRTPTNNKKKPQTSFQSQTHGTINRMNV